MEFFRTLSRAVWRLWKWLCVWLFGVGLLDVLREFFWHNVMETLASHLGTFGEWLLVNPFALLTLGGVLALSLILLVATVGTVSPSHSLVVDTHGTPYLLPSEVSNRVRFGMIGFVVFMGLMMVYGYSKYRSVIAAKENANPPRLDISAKPSSIPSAQPQHPKAERKRLAHVGPKNSSVCTIKGGRYYTDWLTMPGGPKLQRPLLVINKGTLPIVTTEVSGDTFVLIKLVVTNRGEASIIKNWDLCLVQNGKPVIYDSAAIPSAGLVAGGMAGTAAPPETITPDKSLVDSAIKTPVEHAHTAGGWVSFRIPGTELAKEMKSGTETLHGAIQFKDYLDHEYSFDFQSTSETPPLYLPGAP